jgi:hypothetical protein
VQSLANEKCEQAGRDGKRDIEHVNKNGAKHGRTRFEQFPPPQVPINVGGLVFLTTYDKS